ncbi:hypothetical protein B0H14DRAFT_3464276 [Mycena olivaceomarginata]|nr:hypothetical protein B0H14DRAFT_3464276 [Mycena olivaceomarginata]
MSGHECKSLFAQFGVIAKCDVLVALIIVPPDSLNRPNFSMNMTPALSPLDKRPRTEATPLTLVLEVPHLIRLSRGLSTLPDELLMAVFCWADGADEIFIPSTQYHGFETPIRILISLMCKHWARVAWNSLIWRRVNTHIGASTTYAPRIESMLRFLQRGPANSELQIKMSAPKSVSQRALYDDVMRRMARITSLDVRLDEAAINTLFFQRSQRRALIAASA